MENNTNLLGQLNISNYSIHILSKYIHELIFDNVVYQSRGCHRERGWNQQIMMLENGRF
jgi:hypothetical protein